MELLRTITDMEITGQQSTRMMQSYVREAARAVLFRPRQIALLNVSKHGYHKLPGGGIEENESRMDALSREILEETGWKADVVGEVGRIIEIRTGMGMEQHSYCYLANAVKKVSGPTFTDVEIEGGFELEWVRMDNALDVLANDEPDNDMGRYINLRDFIFLKKGIGLIMDGLSSQNKN